MRHPLALCLALTAALALGGCFHEPSAPSVAIVDLEAVAIQTGRKEAMNAEFKSASDALQVAVRETAETLKANLQASETAMRENPNNANQQAHRQLLLESTRQLEAEKRDATEQANKLRQEIIGKFRQEARPVVAQIARLRGATIVLTMTETVLWAENTVDITGDVAKAMASPAGQ